MTLLRSWLATLPGYLWGGWGAIASLLLLVALWEFLAGLYGPLVLPTPLETADTLRQFAASGGPLWPTLAISARRALAGLALAVGLGSVAGVAAGVSMTLWFGTGDGTPVFTVFIASFPVVFAGGMQGARTLEQRWRDLSQVFALPWHMRVTDIYLPHVISYLFPAWIVALGSSWRVVVMAELLASSDGVGAALASSRAQLDMPATLAWIGAVVLLLLALEYLLLEPVKREIERWREAGARREGLA